MPDNNELVNMLRAVIHEELKPINERLDRVEQGQQEFRQEVNTRLSSLEAGQKKLQKDVTTIKKEVSAVWDDIKRLDNRLAVQEHRAIQ